MPSIRLGDVPDIKYICDIAEELLDRSCYAGIKPDEKKFKMTIASMMAYKTGYVIVVVDDDNIPQGFLLGMVEELFFSKEQVAADLAFYVREEYRRYAPRMMSKFIKWAKAKPKVSKIILGISSGFGEPERIGKMYEKLGMTCTGSSYAMRV